MREFRVHLYGDPILRKHCEQVEGTTQVMRDLEQQWPKLREDWRAVGVAAPQLGIAERWFILQLYDANWDLGPAMFYINPVLSEPADEMDIVEEGCLSVPGLRVPVPRPLAVTCEWTDINGKQHKQRFEGYQARQIMHENDHLNGVLQIDRTSKRMRREVDRELRAIKKRANRAA